MRHHISRLGKLVALLALALLLAAPAWAGGHAHPEKYYQAIWCAQNGGQLEVVLKDGSRCDCLTASHAVEFDFGKKWAESVGQALNYARQTNRRAGVVLILEKPQEKIGVERVQAIAQHYKLPLDVWTMEVK